MSGTTGKSLYSGQRCYAWPQGGTDANVLVERDSIQNPDCITIELCAGDDLHRCADVCPVPEPGGEFGRQIDAAVGHHVPPVVVPVRPVERVPLLPGEAVVAEILDVGNVRQVIAGPYHPLRDE